MKYDFLIVKLKQLVASERKITSEIVDLIREIDQRRAYLDYGHASLFSLLTKDFGYTPASAMRRIDAARLAKEVPKIKEDLRSGAINLSQVSLLAQAVRQKQKELKPDLKAPKAQVSKETKVFLLEQVKSLDLVATQKTLANHLDIEVKAHEKKVYQKDESLLLEITLNKQLQQNLERVKQLISHQSPNPTMADVVQFLVTQFLDKKDPLRQGAKNCKETAYSATVPALRHKIERVVKSEKALELKRRLIQKLEQLSTSKKINKSVDRQTGSSKINLKSNKQKTIPLKVRRQVLQNQKCCQWVTPKTNQSGQIEYVKCGSKFQLQIDHKMPRWQDGGHEIENLQVLCGVHNRLKFQREMTGKSVSF